MTTDLLATLLSRIAELEGRVKDLETEVAELRRHVAPVAPVDHHAEHSHDMTDAYLRYLGSQGA